MRNTENKIKEYILGDIFCESPNMENDWEVFMENETNEYPDGFQVCEEYELDSARDIRSLMEVKFEDLMKLSAKITPKDLYILEERDCWYSNESSIFMGAFNSLDAVIELATKEYGELQEDGSNCHYKPINNPYNLTLYINKVTLNELERV